MANLFILTRKHGTLQMIGHVHGLVQRGYAWVLEMVVREHKKGCNHIGAKVVLHKRIVRQ
jgi:hypothetical protein